ncbi:MAG: energy transducer TonB [Bacteroides sp.]|nr:energy transducer TonB [Bacteroides sp.]
MARGKQTCKILKEIRRQIAEANGIEFATSECRYKGDCLGTCPKCEAEVHYLEQQLNARSLAGKAIALAGISAGMILMSGCSGTTSKNQSNDDMLGEFIESPEMIEEIEDTTEGEMPAIEDSLSVFNELPGVKEGEIASDPNVVVTQGEMPDEHPTMPDENGIYACAEQQPEFPGGAAEMLRFIGKNLNYPEEQLKESIQGRVVVQFYVDTLGHICEPKIVRGKDSALDREALRVVRLFPNFTPGTLNGKKVNTYMTLPITFKLPAD